MKVMKKIAPLFVAAAAVLWGAMVIFVKHLGSAGFSAMDIVCIRAYGSVFFLFPGLLLIKKDLLKICWRDSWCFLGTGVFSIVFFSYCYFRNVEISSVAVSSILMYTSPVWVALFSAVLFREKITRMKTAALILAMAGCALVSGITGEVSNVSSFGILLGLGSGIGYSLYSIFGRYALNKGYQPMTVTAYTFLFASIGVLPFVDLLHILQRLNNNPELWVWALGMAFFTSCMSFSLYTIGLKYMEAGRAAVLATLEPIVSAIIGSVYYHESMSIAMVFGIIFVLVSSILISCKTSDKSTK